MSISKRWCSPSTVFPRWLHWHECTMVGRTSLYQWWASWLQCRLTWHKSLTFPHLQNEVFGSDVFDHSCQLFHAYYYCSYSDNLLEKIRKINFLNGGTINNVAYFSFSVSLHRESLLHLAMRWGLAKLSQLLLCLPGGAQALTLPNEEGATPLDLALHGGHSKLVEDITKWVWLLDRFSLSLLL